MDVFSLIFDNKALKVAQDGFEGYLEAVEENNKLFNLSECPGKQKKSQYTLYPYLFLEDFDPIDERKLKILETGSVLYYSYIIAMDGILDKNRELNQFEFIYRNFEAQMAVKILGQIFKPEDKFWYYFNKYSKEFFDGLILESKHQNVINRYKDFEFEEISRGKSALAKIAVAGLGCLTKNYDKIDFLETTQDYLANAFQLHDDLKDWKEDLAGKNYTWLLTEVICNLGMKEDYTEEEITKEIFSKRYDEAILDESIRACDRAILTAGKSKAWIKAVKLHQSNMVALKKDFSDVRKEFGRTYTFFNDLEEKNSLDVIKTKFNVILEKFNKVLYENAKKDYVDVRHWLGFPHESGFTGKEENQEGVVFQHAFIVNLLMDINSMGFQVEDDLINLGLDYWIGEKHKFFKTAWGYFPNLPELSPDVDTYSEVLRVLLKQNLVNSNMYSELDFVVKNNSNSDGSFDTWIIDKNDEDENVQRSLEAAKKMWGLYPDPEVIANFIYTLAVIDSKKYNSYIEKSVEWLLLKQNQYGYWKSTWYDGNYYGAYVCARLFKELNIDNDNVNRLLHYLISSQNTNGSWGELNGNPQDTALSISALIDINNKYNREDLKDCIFKGLNYLTRTFDFDNGFWYNCDFIVMDTERVTGKKSMILKYRSALLTSVICYHGFCKGIKYLTN